MKYNRDKKEEVRLEYLSGIPITDLAEKHGIPRPTVARWRKVGKWDEKPAPPDVDTEYRRALTKAIKNVEQFIDSGEVKELSDITQLSFTMAALRQCLGDAANGNPSDGNPTFNLEINKG